MAANYPAKTCTSGGLAGGKIAGHVDPEVALQPLPHVLAEHAATEQVVD